MAPTGPLPLFLNVTTTEIVFASAPGSVIEPLEGNAHGCIVVRLAIPQCFFVGFEIPEGDRNLVVLFVGINNGRPAPAPLVPCQKPPSAALDHFFYYRFDNRRLLCLCSPVVLVALRFDEGSEGHIAGMIHNRSTRPENDIKGTGTFDLCGRVVHVRIRVPSISLFGPPAAIALVINRWVVAIGINVLLDSISQAQPVFEVRRFDVSRRCQR